MKSAPSPTDSRLDDTYRIASVSRITGIPVQTIRVWESRHRVVSPTRSAGNVRLYRREDIDRLLLVKSAVDAGHAISTVAELTERQLKNRLKDAPSPVLKAKTSGCRVLVCGAALSTVLKAAWKERSDVRVQASLPSLDMTAAGSLPPIDAVIVHAPVLRHDLPAALRQLRSEIAAPVVIVVYGLGSRQILSRLDHANVIALAEPADPAQIARICQLGLAIDPTPAAGFSQLLMHSAAKRRYDDVFLHQLSQMPTSVHCECPNHLADLLTKLNAFERYSLECESTNVNDASMHAMMYSASGHCREFMEEVLGRLLVHEGIPEPKVR